MSVGDGDIGSFFAKNGVFRYTLDTILVTLYLLTNVDDYA